MYSWGAIVHTCLLSTPGLHVHLSPWSSCATECPTFVWCTFLTSASSILLSVIVIRCTLLVLPANVGRHKGAGRLTSVKAYVGAVAHLQRDYSSYHYVDMFTGCISLCNRGAFPGGHQPMQPCYTAATCIINDYRNSFLVICFAGCQVQ